LVFGRRDPFADVVPALPVVEGPALRHLDVGRREDGTPWTVQIAGSHLLVAGATGAGKGSVIWSIIRALAMPVHEGRVQLWCVDPKGGMELSAGAAMFHRFAYDTPAEMADLLDAAVELLHNRAKRMRSAGHRTHTATVVDPLVVLVVDELAFLTAYQPDTALRKRINAALSVLLSKGRAVGFSVVAALQDLARRSPRFVTCFPPVSLSGSPNPNRPGWYSAPGPTIAARSARTSRSASPASAMSSSTDYRTRSGCGPRGSPTTTSRPWPPRIRPVVVT
jgi:S-DNA-T family DNA segregation ATPase FtsK/SpoIIIE